MGHVLNASVEINHYQLVTFDQLIENNDLFKKSIAKDSLITAADDEFIT